MDFNVLKELFSEFSFEDKNFKRDALWLVETMPNNITKEQKTSLKQKLQKLKKGVPLAYIMGFVPFLNCNIFVSNQTLIPRPETELLVDMLIKKQKDKKPKTLDLCSGSGCIGIALHKALNTQVICSDINPKCIKIIEKNKKANNVNIKTIQSDMFQEITETFDLIVSNPPYIPTNDINHLEKSVKDFEPKLALDGGNDGLKFYRIIADEAANYLNKNGMLALEIGYNQAKDIKSLLKENFKNIEIIKDYSKIERFILATRRWKKWLKN